MVAYSRVNWVNFFNLRVGFRIMIVGLTGGLGCGKSTVLEFFNKAGWLTVSADELCHCLYDDSFEVRSAIREHWGGEVFDAQGVVDRKRIAAIVFGHNNEAENELDWLMSLMHPAIYRAATAIINNRGESPVMFEAPLLFEADWDGMCDKTVAIYTESTIRNERLRRLRGFTSLEISRRLRGQITDYEKLHKADYGLINNESIEILQQQCNLLITELTGVDHE